MKTVNKKIKNATSLVYKGVQYKSNLEVSCKKALDIAGLQFAYETEKFNLIESFTPALHFYQSTKMGLKKQCKKNGSCLTMRPVSYTPDFWFGNDKILIFIETKGFRNDVYPYKRKLFFRHMTAYKMLGGEEGKKREIYFFEPSNIRDIKESIGIIKKILNNGN